MTAAVHMVHDVGRIEELLVSCARNVITGIEPPGGVLLQSIRSLQRTGTTRLEALADGLHPPVMDAGYLRRGCELTQLQVRFDEHARVLPRGPARSTAELCTALAAALVEASRHAARAA